MIHKNNEIQEVREMVEKKLFCSIKHYPKERPNRIQAYGRRIFISLIKGVLNRPLKLIEIETGLATHSIYYHLNEHNNNSDKVYQKLYLDCLESFKKLFYRNLTDIEKINYHQEEINKLTNNLDVKEFELLESV